MTQQEILEFALKVTEHDATDEWLHLHRDTLRDVINLAYIAGGRAELTKQLTRINLDPHEVLA